MSDLATRVYNHTFNVDPIVRSLLDTDIYKLLMLQMIWKEGAKIPVRFSLINRTVSEPLAQYIEEKDLREQLDHARTLEFTNKEMIWLAGNTFYGKQRLFEPTFVEWLRRYKLPEYSLERNKGQWTLEFEGAWEDVTLWEIPALAIMSEIRSRMAMNRKGRFALDVLYARAKAKLWSKLEQLSKIPETRIADFGTRRRHSFLWQRWCIEAMKEALGEKFIGTSNTLHAMEHDIEAIGTNAHELTMVEATRLPRHDAVREAPYRVLQRWEQLYDGNLLIALPDTYGTSSFLNYAPRWVATWKGFQNRLQGTDRRRRRSHLVVARKGRKSNGKAAHILRWNSM